MLCIILSLQYRSYTNVPGLIYIAVSSTLRTRVHIYIFYYPVHCHTPCVAAVPKRARFCIMSLYSWYLRIVRLQHVRDYSHRKRFSGHDCDHARQVPLDEHKNFVKENEFGYHIWKAYCSVK